MVKSHYHNKKKKVEFLTFLALPAVVHTNYFWKM